MSKQSKPSIVFAHGIWADGSCFQKLIPTLRAEGYEVMAAQYGLDTVKGDVDAVIRTFGRVSGPIVLVGHSYGGTVITHAGVDPRVAALVYIASVGRPGSQSTGSAGGLIALFAVMALAFVVFGLTLALGVVLASDVKRHP